MTAANYEFHLTAPRRTILYLNSEMENLAQGVPILAVENLDSEGITLDVNWMTCARASLQGGHSSALHYLFNLQADLGLREHTTLKPIRKKIEVEYRADLDPEEFIYIETHYQVSEEGAKELKSGISRNLFSGKIIATERCYDPKQFHSFAETHSHRKVELCLFDSDQSLDAEGKWLKIPKNFKMMSDKTGKALSNDYGKLFTNFHRNTKRWEVH